METAKAKATVVWSEGKDFGQQRRIDEQINAVERDEGPRAKQDQRHDQTVNRTGQDGDHRPHPDDQSVGSAFRTTTLIQPTPGRQYQPDHDRHQKVDQPLGREYGDNIQHLIGAGQTVDQSEKIQVEN